MTVSLFDRPAVLFLPASRASAIAKARTSAADLIILDLEDAVRGEDKDAARVAAIAAIATPWPMPVAIRVNGIGTEWYELDIAAAAASDCDLIVFPGVEKPLPRLNKPVAAMIENAAGVLSAAEIARSCEALIVGTNDLAADLRMPSIDRSAMGHCLQATVVAARAAGIAVFDGVFNRLDDPHGFAAEAVHSRSLGFDGKTLIHPDQIAPCHAAFAPSASEVARAERLVLAAADGAARFEGEMVEAMHVDAARRLIERSRR